MQEYEFSRTLGDTVKFAREKSALTQEQVADRIGIQSRTVLNIENYRGNPKMEVLYPLIRTLKIDACNIFYPELQQNSPALRQLHLMLTDCSEDEALILISVFKPILTAIRNNKAERIQ